MPRPRQNSAPQLSPGQASYVLDRLVGERRISAGEIARYVGDMQREIGELERRLEALRSAASGGSGAAAPVRRGPGRPPGSGAKAGGAKRRGRPGRPPASASAAAAPAAPAAASKGGAKGGAKGRRKSAITPEQLASRQLQGRYLGLIRQIPASRRAQYQKIAKEKGREAAIREMESAIKK